MTQDTMRVVKVSLKALVEGTVTFDPGWRVAGTISSPNAISYVVGKARGDVFVTLVRTEEVE